MTDDERDLGLLYETYHARIVRYLRRVVGESEAEDVAQEVFIKAGRALDGFRGEASLSTWIYRIATNAATDHLRKHAQRRAAVPDDSPEDDALPEGMAQDDDLPVADSLLIRKDMNECIRGIVDGLPENYRTVLVLSEIEGFTNAEIAEVTGLSLETVKIRLHRARSRLRKELQTKCDFYRDERNELACDRKNTTLKFIKK